MRKQFQSAWFYEAQWPALSARLSISLWPECLQHLPARRLPSLPQATAREDAEAVPSCGLGQDHAGWVPSPSSAIVPVHLGSYERRSFIRRSLIHRPLSSARKPGEDQTQEHTQGHDDVGDVGDNHSRVNHRLESTCRLFVKENTLVEIHHWENHGSDVPCFKEVI